MRLFKNRIAFMEDGETMFPLEFFLVGTPISLQGTRASIGRWKSEVEQAARLRISQTVDLPWLKPTPLAVTIFYFPTEPMGGDIDNIVKPILDALIKVAYLDDQSVERVLAQKFEPDVAWGFASPSDKLSAALDKAKGFEFAVPVVYILIENHLRWRTVS
jgi:crossover junction endodeoxyribonuclease RusA